LGDNLRVLRVEKNMTQEGLAEICNLHRTYIGAIERGDRNISIDNIVKIANALDVSPAYLLTINS
ncbi:MAG: helix-turn-helix transcriptional regulator, partial [Anaerovoracaceae bacterium]